MNSLRLCLLLTTLWPAAVAQEPQQQPLTARLQELLLRESNGHSPTDAEIASMSTLSPAPSAEDLRAAVPLLAQALASPDGPARAYALTTLTGLETPAAGPATPPLADSAPAAAIPVAFPTAAQAALVAILPQIGARLTDEIVANRLLTATVLGGFTPDPPAAVFPPLYAFLKREDAVSPVGLAVVDDLLSLAPLSAETSAVVARYLKRADQTGDSRASLVDAISTHANQSPALNAAVVGLMNTDDPTLRSRVILSLPALDLAPDVYMETRTRLQQMIDNASESLQVVNAAKAVAPCWTSVKMTSGCPVYP